MLICITFFIQFFTHFANSGKRQREWRDNFTFWFPQSDGKDYSVYNLSLLTTDPAVVSPTTRRGPAPSEAIWEHK